MQWEKYDRAVGYLSIVLGTGSVLSFLAIVRQTLDSQQILAAIVTALSSIFFIFLFRKAILRKETLAPWQRIAVLGLFALAAAFLLLQIAVLLMIITGKIVIG